MIPVTKRIQLLCSLGEYMMSDSEGWNEAKHRAVLANSWFTPGNIELSVKSITANLLTKEKLNEWLANYTLPVVSKTVGIVMAGNIPLVGFHDFICGFISGHQLKLKLSSKDEVLIRHLINKLTEWEHSIADNVVIADVLKGCDAYIATGSNNTARYFDQYFGKYPNIIRKNRTSVAVLDGTETNNELSLLADDIFSYFGLGCRNVTQICVPEGYDFNQLLDACNKYADLILHHKYKHNYDYYLAIYLLNKVPYITNENMLLVENQIPFSAVSVLHYRFYNEKNTLLDELRNNTDIQCIVGRGSIAFGNSQLPHLTDYADGVDTMQFLCNL